MGKLFIVAEWREDGQAPQILGEAEVVRLDKGSADRPVGDYAWRLGLPGRRAWKTGQLRGFPRKQASPQLHVWDLFYRVLRVAVHHRNRGGDS